MPMTNETFVVDATEDFKQAVIAGDYPSAENVIDSLEFFGHARAAQLLEDELYSLYDYPPAPCAYDQLAHDGPVTYSN